MKKVLLVNDSRFESLIMKDTLSTIGFDVSISDEYSAIGRLESFKPDVFISNYIMREIKGDQLIARIKAKNPRIKCYLSSSSPSVGEAMMNKGIDGFIKTPVEENVLEKILTESTYNEDSYFVSIEKQNAGIQRFKKTFCEACLQEINKAGEKQFAFCPFCGHKL